MTIFDLVFLITVPVCLGLLLRLAYLIVVQQRLKAKRVAVALLALLASYSALLVIVGLFSRPQILSLRTEKCFDEWCVQLNSGFWRGDRLEIQLETHNHGRRTQAPDEPKAFLVEDGHPIPLQVPGLDQKVPGGSSNQISLKTAVPAGTGSLQLLVTEGGSPTLFIIDNENSPFHAKTAWNLDNVR